jgi:hypothetical protein
MPLGIRAGKSPGIYSWAFKEKSYSSELLSCWNIRAIQNYRNPKHIFNRMRCFQGACSGTFLFLAIFLLTEMGAFDPLAA